MVAGKENFLQVKVMAVTRVYLRNNDGMVVGAEYAMWYH